MRSPQSFAFLPRTKNTISFSRWLKLTGWATAVSSAASDDHNPLQKGTKASLNYFLSLFSTFAVFEALGEQFSPRVLAWWFVGNDNARDNE